MFGRGAVELNPRKFWSWFASEAQGIANALEALQRGESDAEWAIIGLNERIRRFDNTLEADVVRTLDGQCHLTILGEPQSVSVLLDAECRPAPSRLAVFAPRRLDGPAPRALPHGAAPFDGCGRRPDFSPARSIRLSACH